MISPGDKVVCVDDSACKCCGQPVPVKRDVVYVITGFRVWRNVLALHLTGVLADHGDTPNAGINSNRFRKLTDIQRENQLRKEQTA